MLRVKEIRNVANGTIYIDPYYVEYLCFEDSSGSSNTLTLTKNNTGGLAPAVNLEYSTDGTTWNVWSESNNVRTYTIPANGKVYLRGDNTAFGNTQNTTDYYNFSSSGNINASGDLMTIIDKTGQTKTAGDAAFRQLFRNWTYLITPPSISATTVGNLSMASTFENCRGITTAPQMTISSMTGTFCCYDMFKDCRALTDASNVHLNATLITESSYKEMFNECRVLVTPPVFTSSGLSVLNDAMFKMFYDCFALVVAPSLIISSVGGAGCNWMFYGCSQLTDTTGVKLNATSLPNGAYKQMFRECRSLVTPPEIMATTLSDGDGNPNNGSLAFMFYNCTKLNEIKVHFTDWYSGSCTSGWVYGTKSTGTFYKPSTLPSTKNTSGNISGSNYIPYDWTTIDI